MDAEALRSLLDDVASGVVEADEAVRLLRALPFADLGNARVDHHRTVRQGLPEAVYGPGKTPEDVALIVGELLAGGAGPVVLTRAGKEQFTSALAVDATGTVLGTTAIWRRADDRPERVAVVTAGTADLPVADECAAAFAKLLAAAEWRTYGPGELLLREGEASGELAGMGRWRLFEDDGVTAVVYEWHVRTTKSWMNLFSPIAKPVFAWNHDYVMRNGGEGLAKLLGAQLLVSD